MAVYLNLCSIYSDRPKAASNARTVLALSTNMQTLYNASFETFKVKFNQLKIIFT